MQGRVKGPCGTHPSLGVLTHWHWYLHWTLMFQVSNIWLSGTDTSRLRPRDYHAADFATSARVNLA